MHLALERGDWHSLERLFAAMERLAELRADLEARAAEECFDAGEFLSRLRAANAAIRAVEERLG